VGSLQNSHQWVQLPDCSLTIDDFLERIVTWLIGETSYHNQLDVQQFKNLATGSMSCEEVQKVFRAGRDRDVSGQVRNLIRTKGTKSARQIARKALQRRNLI